MAKIKRSLPEITHADIVKRELADEYKVTNKTIWCVVPETYEQWGNCAGITHVGFPILFSSFKDAVDYTDMEKETFVKEYRDADYTEEEIEEHLSERDSSIRVEHNGKMVNLFSRTMYTVYQEQHKYVIYPTEIEGDV